MEKHLLLGGFLFLLTASVSSKPLIRDKRAFSYIANSTVCVVDHVVYHDGDPIPTDDPCETCKCRPPGFSCILRECEVKPGCKAIRRDGECCPEYQCGCEHNGRFFNDGDRIPNAESPCYTCYCQGSSITCALADCKFRFDCEPEYVSGECCPRYDHCPPEPTVPTTTKLTSPWTTLPPTTLLPTTLIAFSSTLPFNETHKVEPTTTPSIETTKPFEISTIPASPSPVPENIANDPPIVTESTEELTTTPKTLEDEAQPLEIGTTTVLPEREEVVTNELSPVTTTAPVEVATTISSIEVEAETIKSTLTPTVISGVNQEPTVSNEIELEPMRDPEVTVLPVISVEGKEQTTQSTILINDPTTTSSPIDEDYEKKMVTASLSEESYPTTIKWIPSDELIAEHKEIDDLEITTLIPAVLADALDVDAESNIVLEAARNPPIANSSISSISSGTTIAPIEELERLTTVQLPSEVIVTETVFVDSNKSDSINVNVIDTLLELNETSIY